MKRSTEQLLTTHTGSLPRPERLRELLTQRHVGKEFDRDELEREVARATVDVLHQQIENGLTVINDGEFSKYGFSTYIKDRLTGFEDVNGGYDRTGLDHLPAGERRTALEFPEFFIARGHSDGLVRRAETDLRTTECTGPVAWKDFSLVTRDIEVLTGATQGLEGDVEVFVSALSPGTVLMVTPNKFYPSSEEYLCAVADAMREEYKAIVEAGFLLHIDCPDLAGHLLDGELVRGRARETARPFDIAEFRREVARNIEVLNYATRDLPPEQMRIHVCWGSTEHPHHLDAELPDLVDLLLTCRPAGMTIVAANGRHEHEWRVWEDLKLPEGKVIIPGVIDSTTNIIEHPKTVADRLLRFASVLGKENIIAGVDCGFATTAGRDQVHPRIAWAKLRSLVEGAQLASAELWR